MTHSLASVSFSQSVQNLLNTIAHSIPKIVVFLIVLIVGWIVARLIRQAVEMLLKRVHFDRMAERGSIGSALRTHGYNATSLLARIIYYAVLLFTLQMAFGVFGSNPISHMLDAIVGWLPKAFVAIILVVVASAIAKVVRDLVGTAMSGLSYGRFVASAAAIVIIALGVIAALDQIDIAAAVTQPILIAILATAGAILAIGVGGGMIRPMEQRWERMLNAAERETSGLAAYQRGRQDALSSPGAVAGMAGGDPSGEHGGGEVYAGQGAPAQETRYAGPQVSGYTGSQGGGYSQPQGESGTRPMPPGPAEPGPGDDDMPPRQHHGRPGMP